LSSDKPLPITKVMVWKAYQQVRRNGQAAGVDGQSLDDFNKDLENNLYKLWNRMASGSYLPPPVRRVEIPKSSGGIRPLGIPTVADRIAQMVVKQVLEPQLEPIFDQDSYGYRPGKSAHQAVEMCRQRCWRSNWVLDLDIKGFFDAMEGSPEVGFTFKIHEVTRYLSRTRHILLDGSFVINNRLYEGLPAEQKAAIDRAAREAAATQRKEHFEREASWMDRFRKESKLEINDVNLQAFADKLTPLHNEFATAAKATDVVAAIKAA